MKINNVEYEELLDHMTKHNDQLADPDSPLKRKLMCRPSEDLQFELADDPMNEWVIPILYTFRKENK